MGDRQKTGTIGIANGVTHTWSWNLPSGVVDLRVETDGALTLGGDLLAAGQPERGIDSAAAQVNPVTTEIVNGTYHDNAAPIVINSPGRYTLTVANTSGGTRLYSVRVTVERRP